MPKDLLDNHTQLASRNSYLLSQHQINKQNALEMLRKARNQALQVLTSITTASI
jgi:hypothetical protein